MFLRAYADDNTLHFSTSYNRHPTQQELSDSRRDAIGHLTTDLSLVRLGQSKPGSVQCLKNSISTSILQFMTPCSLQNRPPRGWPQQKGLYLSLSKHSLLASSIPPLLSATFFIILITLPELQKSHLAENTSFSSHVLLHHLTTGFPLLLGLTISHTYTFFTKLSTTLPLNP